MSRCRHAGPRLGYTLSGFGDQDVLTFHIYAYLHTYTHMFKMDRSLSDVFLSPPLSSPVNIEQILQFYKKNTFANIYLSLLPHSLRALKHTQKYADVHTHTHLQSFLLT